MPRARTLWAALVSCAAILFWNSVCRAQQELPDMRGCQELTADWPLWSALSLHPWTRGEVDQKIYFSLDRLKAALHAVPLTAPARLMSNETEDYAHKVPARPGLRAYSAAAKFYTEGDFKKAIPLLDKIVADRDSGYRAAAAYTAARAALLLGDLEGGGARIDAFVRDPALQEFAGPAYELFGKIRYQSDAAPLNAAQMSQISFMLTAPTEAVCGSVLGEQLRREVDDDFSWLIGVPLTDNRWTRFTSRTIASTAMAKLDPVVEFASIVKPLTKFETSDYGRGEEGWQDPIPPELTAHIRERWDVTQNPLWAVALAEHTTTEADLDRITKSLPILRAWPALPTSAQARYAWRIVAQIVRIKLVGGKTDEALAAVSLLAPDDLAAGRSVRPQPDISKAQDIILASGIRWFVRRNDFASARAWAVDVTQRIGVPVPEKLKPLLVRNLDELYGDPLLGLKQVGGVRELGDFRVIFDLYSSHQLMEISHRPDIAPDDRRAFVGAAWIRAFALEHWGDVTAWLPDLRHAFPEIGSDADAIERTWFRGTARHRTLLLVLRTPGLNVLPSWARPPGGPEFYGFSGQARDSDVRRFDYENASDGNWWCSLDAEETLASTTTGLIHDALYGYFYTYVDPKEIDRTAGTIAAYPLLASADTAELHVLSNAGSATKRLAEAAVKWGGGITWFDRLLGRDRDVPEALARSVAATRYGCRRPPENGPWSRAAYELLHRNYPDSDWAKRTKYWFDTIRPAE